MSKSLQHGIALAAVVILIAWAGAPRASEKLARDTGRACTACHDKPGSKLLTDQGKYFETTRALDGYEELKASFARCTACHVRRPGSSKLTRKGQKFAEVAKDMVDLRDWLQAGHPAPIAR